MRTTRYRRLAAACMSAWILLPAAVWSQAPETAARSEETPEVSAEPDGAGKKSGTSITGILGGFFTPEAYDEGEVLGFRAGGATHMSVTGSGALNTFGAGAFAAADIPVAPYFRTGPSLGLIYLNAGVDGGGRINRFDIPIRLRGTFVYSLFRASGYAGYTLSASSSSGDSSFLGLWNLGTQLGAGPVYLEYDLLFGDGDAAGRIGLGLEFRIFKAKEAEEEE